MRARRFAAYWAALGMVTLSPRLARSEPSAEERTNAEALFEEGRSLVSAGRTGDACPKFAESQRLDPQLGTLLHLATCHEQQGRTATAWREFNEAITQAERANQHDRETLARKRALALEARLSRMRVVVNAAENVELAIDGNRIESPNSEAGLPIDPGEHTLEARAPGKRPRTMKVIVGAGPSMMTVEIPVLEAEAPSPAPKPALRPVPPDVEGNKRVLGYGLGGGAIVALGVGTFFGLRVSSLTNDANKDCAGRYCTQDALDKHDAASASALVSTVAFAVGLTAAAAAVYFVFLDHPAAPHAAR